MKVVRLSALCNPAFTPREYSWYSFLLKAESTPGPQGGRKDYVTEKFQSHHRESNLQSSGLYHSASTNCATAYSKMELVNELFAYVTADRSPYPYIFVLCWGAGAGRGQPCLRANNKHRQRGTEGENGRSDLQLSLP
jgi:hypothetical protein